MLVPELLRNWSALRRLPRPSLALQHRRLYTSRSVFTRDVEESSTATPPSTVNGLLYPDPPTTAHHDLPSFLEHAERMGMTDKTPTFIGTHFEYTAIASLSDYGFHLRRIGGQSDLGIDLIGTWAVPSSPQRPLRVLVQCKASPKSGPGHIRELEGAFNGAPAGWRGSNVLAFLVTNRRATQGTMEALRRSRWPMGYISCTRLGHIEQIVWNRRAEDEGLHEMGIGLRHSLGQDEEQLVLTFKGKHLPFPFGEEAS
ncbi:hypothetical protein QBC47DRAFT_195617 [Echria macrotheca]|uniref:Required for respiratory growth protein 7, mitochondrial n=1 Tax=Echria macrotheca TaxID=438768 RepID=A0AAJ0FC26_9PEZI|nr:hypothetical protein QBC47DRAFT_195617 [Echria macrotheca]